MGQVKVLYLNKEELEKARIGAKCDLANRPKGRVKQWNWKPNEPEKKPWAYR
jgi:hypothetical protein